MAAARRGNRLKARTRRPPLPLRALRSLAALTLAGLVGLVGYDQLREAGFVFRWELERSDAASRRSAAASEAVETTPNRGGAEQRGVVSALPAGGNAGFGGEPSAETRPAGAVGSVADSEARVAGLADVGLEAPPAGSDPVGVGDFASIDFETLGDGRAACTNCPASDQWRAQGLLLSFRSWTASSTRPYVLDARNFLPADASKHALGPALADERGLEVGVIRLDFPGRPRKVAFTLYGPDLIRSFAVSAWSQGERLPIAAQVRSLQEKYNPAGRALFRAERVLVEWDRGVDRISLDGWGPPGHVLLIDDLAIDP